MSVTAIFFAILGALLIGAVSPGPCFVLVSRIAITASRRNGLAAALGIGLGGALFGCLAVAGLTALLLKLQWLYIALKFIGGVYLLILGIRIFRGATAPLSIDTGGPVAAAPLLRSFSTAFVTQISNPKAAVVYASVFAALMPKSPPLWLLLALPPMLLFVEASWYAIVAIAFSAASPRAIYLNSRKWIDRIAGTAMGGLGLRLLVEGFRAQKS